MINLYCPDFYVGKDIYALLHSLKQQYPEAFYEDVTIKKIFGNGPGSIWNGGGTSFSPFATREELEEIKNLYEQLQIPLQITFTNPMIEEQHLSDTYSNLIFDIFDNGINEFLVSNSLLENYLRQKHPQCKIARSIVNTPTDLDWVSLLDTTYNTVVLPRRYTKDFEYLDKIPVDYRNRMELLCNDPCPIDCPRLYSHYELYGKKMLFQPIDNSLVPCTNEKLDTMPFRFNIDGLVTIDDIRQLYIPKHFTEFKLSGRGSKTSILTSVIPYLVKPKYQFLAYRHIISFC